jgi:hypothetical protein
MTNKKKHSRRRRLNPRFVGMVCVVAALLAGVILWIVLTDGPADELDTATGDFIPIGKPDIQLGELQNMQTDLGNNLKITDMGSYTGVYMEDGSDEIVSRVLMIVVKNTGEKTVQYGQVSLTNGKVTANFTLTTLPPGESVVLLEQSRMSYADAKSLTQSSASAVTFMETEPSLLQDHLKIQSLDGAMNITNISGEDITGDIVIYYKNAAADLLYGGITYRITVRGGLKKDEVRQISVSHLSAVGSRVMFITIG